MICLITTAMPTVATKATVLMEAPLGLIAMIFLSAFLAAQEFGAVAEDSKLKLLGQNLSPTVIPLLFVFALIMLLSMVETLY
jgi:hypothetical protein